MAKAVWNPGALLAPVPPTLVTCGDMETHNVLTVAWTGILCTKPPITYVSVRPQRHSYQMIKDSGAFAINLPDTKLVRAVDFCGVRSGATVDKFAEMKLTAEPGVRGSAPTIAECPISLECSVLEIKELGSHHMFLAEVKSVLVGEQFIDKAGKLHIDRCDLLCYAHGSYFGLDKVLGTFGYSVRKKPKAGTRRSSGRSKSQGPVTKAKLASGKPKERKRPK